MSEQLKGVLNKVRLTGKLAEVIRFDIRDTDKGPAASFKGVIQFGESSAETRRFEGYINKFKSNGDLNENFDRAVALIQNGTPMTKSKENPTELVLDGQIDCNDYMSASSPDPIETIALKVSFIREKAENDPYEAKIQIEGYIQNYIDETRGTGADMEPTGRKRLSLVTANYRNEAIVLKNLILTQETLENFEKLKNKEFEEIYQKGCTAKFYLKYLPSEKRKAPVGGGTGFGEQVVTEGTNFVELVVVGSPETPENDPGEGKFDTDLVKNLLSERTNKLLELKEKGATTKKSTPSSSTFKETANPDDIPF